jgi:pyruvyltransferase
LNYIKRALEDHRQSNFRRNTVQPYPVVETIYYRPKSGVNFGDELSRVIVQLMLARKGHTILDEARRPTKLLCIGSILHAARDGDVVWGSGRNGKTDPAFHQFTRLDVRAVRGPRTRAFLLERGIAVPEVYGDPALLLPRLTGDRFTKAERSGIGLVPNLNDFEHFKELAPPGVTLIDPRQSWSVCVDQITRCASVVASSLHGLIVAEAFGIKAQYVSLTQEEHPFKYLDYFEGTGRQDAQIAGSIEDALAAPGHPAPTLKLDAMEAAFPYDLWL